MSGTDLPCRQDEQEHWHKQILWGRESPEEFGAGLFRLASRCGYREAEEKIFAADGGDWCWTIHQTCFADATGILDWYHANEHVWTCAKTLFSAQAEITAWAEDALTHMHDEGVTDFRNGSWLRNTAFGTRSTKPS